VAPTDLVTLSEFLGFAPQHIFYVVRLADDMYFEFQIKKANGGLRKIAAPRTELKGIQRAILEKILEIIPCNDACFAYVRGRSVVQAARKISGHKAVLRLDIKDFFPTITQKRVFGFFTSVGYNSTVSYILTKLCTLNGRLCQGAPTSPGISNLIFRAADKQLTSLAETFKLQYIRYSDDIFFYADRNFRYPRVAEVAAKIIRRNGFQVNVEKTRFHRRNSPRFTLGLQTMGREPHFSRYEKRRYRAAFFKASSNLNWGRQKIDVLLGMAEWHKAVYGPDALYQDYIRIIGNAQNIKIHDVYVQA
jgi:RNA-directed DNA polymerase